MEDNKQVHVYAQTENNEIIIREGTTPDIFVPKAIEAITTINGPANYWEVVGIKDGASAMVTYSIEKGNIIFTDDLRSQSYVKLTGKLVDNPDLQVLCINASAGGIAPRDLALKLKKLRHIFPDQDSHVSLVRDLLNLKANISTEIESSEQQKGDRKRLVDKIVNSNIQNSFKINAPIYIGEPAVEMFIDIYVDTSESDVRIQLHSPDLIQKKHELTYELIQRELDRFPTSIPKLHLV